MVVHLIIEKVMLLLCAVCTNMYCDGQFCCCCIPLRLGCFLIAFANFIQGMSMVGVYYSVHQSKATGPLSLAYLTYGIVIASFSILLFFGILRGLVAIGGEMDLVPARKDFKSTKSQNIAVFTTEAFAAGGDSERNKSALSLRGYGWLLSHWESSSVLVACTHTRYGILTPT